MKSKLFSNKQEILRQSVAGFFLLKKISTRHEYYVLKQVFSNIHF